MRYLFWLIKFLLFVVLFGFAMHNAEPVTLNFFLGYVWQAPLALLLLIAFVLGTVFGILAVLGKVVRLRRELVSLRKEVRTRAASEVVTVDAALQPPRDAL
ncbi:lipopolysaccharide assembly protein LapA domain-containing protein [Jeongeupia wiesaeckerbachi]|uniref:LapA family protein n=1 Tax=Jeongeupia wiesaeckerbachi TaxID=3051218 RepID=UPI003D801B56